MSTDLLAGLNPQQHAATTAGEGPVLVLAGPGSGKTGVLTRRVAYLIREMGVKPWHIMAVTFTNKASREMRHRIEGYLGERLRGLQIGTFHATCARILRIEHQYTNYGEDYTIYDSDDQLSAVKQAMGELNMDTKKFAPRRVLGAISNAKNEMILPADFVGGDYFSEIVSRVYPRYQTILQDSNAMDFDDLLVQMVLALRNHEDLRRKYQERYQFVLVDEFQDTNQVQYELVSLFGAPQNNIFVVGDEDQSIYAFRGADYRNVMRFRQDFPAAQVVLLEQNYRSTQIVLDAARAVIDKNSNRTPKALFTDREGGAKITIYEAYDDEYEARFIMDTVTELRRGREGYDYSDFAVMYRTNAQSRSLEEACVRMGIPYTIVGGVGFYGRREIRDMLAYLRVVSNPDDRISFARIINTPKRGIGKKSLQDFQYWAAQAELRYGDALDYLLEGGETSLSKRTANLFAKFGEQLRKWRALAAESNLVTLYDAITSDIGYHLYLHDISNTHDQAEERAENLAELRGLLARFDDEALTLADFLQEQQLMSDADRTDDAEERDGITLLTLHAAKGLEYPVVFITGLEDGLLPHSRSFDDPEGLAEERRLFYVGITRAKDRLYLTHAFRRALYGGFSDSQPKSGFLFDLPEALIDTMGAGTATWQRDEQRYREITTWDTPSNNNRLGSGLSRLNNDLRKQPKDDSAPKKHVSDEGLRRKIIPFPGGNVGNDPLRYNSGMRVQHPTFGVGTVIESVREDQSELVTVAFQNKKFGIKKLDAEFAQMKILD
jgi:DNA helicase-2/ATP-dependent DNA helicase PcrA